MGCPKLILALWGDRYLMIGVRIVLSSKVLMCELWNMKTDVGVNS